MNAEELSWISVNERLPEERVQVFVLGEISNNVPFAYSDGNQHNKKPREVWVDMRVKPNNLTDGNGFLRLFPHGNFIVTHWFPIPKLNGKTVLETLPG